MPLSRAGDATSGSFARIQYPFLMLRLSHRSLAARLHCSHFACLLSLSISILALPLSLDAVPRITPPDVVPTAHNHRLLTACADAGAGILTVFRHPRPSFIFASALLTSSYPHLSVTVRCDDPFWDVDSRGSFDGWGCFWDCCALTGVAHWCKAETRIHTATSTRLIIFCIKYGR